LFRSPCVVASTTTFAAALRGVRCTRAAATVISIHLGRTPFGCMMEARHG
jgi:hypothetical protein